MRHVDLGPVQRFGLCSWRSSEAIDAISSLSNSQAVALDSIVAKDQILIMEKENNQTFKKEKQIILLVEKILLERVAR